MLQVAWYCMLIYRMSNPEIRFFKEIHMTVVALPQPRAPLNTRLKLVSAGCEAVFLANSSVRMRWRNSGWWCNPTGSVGQAVRHWFILSLRRKIPAANAFISHLISCKQSHKTPLPGHISNCRKVRGWSDMMLFAVGASVAGLQWHKLSTLVVAFVNVT